MTGSVGLSKGKSTHRYAAGPSVHEATGGYAF